MTCHGLSFFSINGCVFKVISCLANRAQFSGYQVKILNLKHVIKHLISEKILTNNCCFEICKQKAFETWLLLFLVVNVTVIIGIFLYNCIGFILKMNLTIQKLHLNLKKEELFIRDNGHEVYLIFLLSMLFFLLCKKTQEEWKVHSIGKQPQFLICVEVIQIKLIEQILQWHSVRWGGDKLIPYKWDIKTMHCDLISVH